MSGKHELVLKSYEAHHASICIAIVYGIIAGHIASTGIYQPYGIYLAIGLGFIIPWLICEYTFPSAHRWYGPKAWVHRAYDAIGIAISMTIYFCHV